MKPPSEKPRFWRGETTESPRRDPYRYVADWVEYVRSITWTDAWPDTVPMWRQRAEKGKR